MLRVSVVMVVALTVGIAFARPAAAQTSVEQLSVYRCTDVKSPHVLVLEDLGEAVLIGLEPPAPGEAGYSQALAATRKFALNKSVKVEPCPVQQRDDEDRLRVIVYFSEGGRWYLLNTKLLRAGLARWKDEPNCHVNVKEWTEYWVQAKEKGRGLFRGQRAPKTRPVSPTGLTAMRPSVPAAPSGSAAQNFDLMLAQSLLQVTTTPRLPSVRVPAPSTPRPAGITQLGSILETEQMMLPVSEFPTMLQNQHRQVTLLYGQLADLEDRRQRTVVLERELTAYVRRRGYDPRRALERVLVEVKVSPGETPLLQQFLDRVERLRLTNRPEPLSEILSWFPEYRNIVRSELRKIGAALVGGVSGATGAGGAPGGGGRMPGMGGAGGGMPEMGGPGGGMPGMGGPGGGMPGMGGPGGGMPGMGGPGGGAPGATAGAALGVRIQSLSFPEVRGMIRAGDLEPDKAALFILALQAYRQELNEEIDLTRRQLRRALEAKARIEKQMRAELGKVERAMRRGRRR